MSETPNLFQYATSELSQDAFICWLLQWANKKYVSVDKLLNQCGQELLKALFKKQNEKLSIDIKRVDIRRQDKNIDILCIVNEKYAIIIEDKTNTVNHSNQLVRYYSEISQRGEFAENEIIRIYFKTGDQSNYKDVNSKEYRLFHRTDFLKVLNTYEGGNQILIDYRRHLQSIQDGIESFKTYELDKWNTASWIGFYINLQRRLNDGDWGYVPNPSGGFQALWWHFIIRDDCKLYLQLEKEKLCLKIEVSDKSRRATLRNYWHERVLSKAKEVNLQLIKPKRFGSGTWMTVCMYDGDYRMTRKGKLDIEGTIAILKKAESLLDYFKNN